MMAAGLPASELGQRVLSGLVLATVTLVATVSGGWINAVFWTVAALVVLVEWQKLVSGAHRPPLLAVGALAVVTGALGAFPGMPFALWLGLGIGAAVTTALVFMPHGGLWPAGGVLYAMALVMASVLCRGSGPDGVIAMLFLFAAVWGTDIVAYFAGRAFGGPKLWPQVSPKKTWSGAIGGVAGALIGCMVVLMVAGIALRPGHIAMALILSTATQAGDLLESAIKRRFDAKDAGQLIPGHGGLMDRVDGFIVAAAVAAVIGTARAGLDAVPAGIIQW
jgi:phosphatidate cytidylyltransferase